MRAHVVEVPAADDTGVYPVTSGMSVVILQIWTATPIFHEPIRGTGYNGYARCNVDLWYRNQAGQYCGAKGEWIPVKHAIKFGRPCKRCYP